LAGRPEFDSGKGRDVHSVQTGIGAHPASYTMCTGGFFPGVKRLRRETDHSPPSSSDVKNGEAIPPLLHTSLWRRAQLIEHRDNFTCLPYLHLSLSNSLLCAQIVFFGFVLCLE
jgi:hypothetical protein